jgi:hypothetical protein
MVVDGACIFLHILFSKLNPFFLNDQVLPIVATNLTMAVYCIGTVIVEKKFSRWSISM